MPLSTAGTYSFGIETADRLVLELVALAALLRCDVEHDVAVLALAARLAHELALPGRTALRIVSRYADLRPCRRWPRRLNSRFHAVDEDFQVQLTHAGD